MGSEHDQPLPWDEYTLSTFLRDLSMFNHNIYIYIYSNIINNIYIYMCP